MNTDKQDLPNPQPGDRGLILEVVHDLERRVMQSERDGYPQRRDPERQQVAALRRLLDRADDYLGWQPQDARAGEARMSGVYYHYECDSPSCPDAVVIDVRTSGSRPSPVCTSCGTRLKCSASKSCDAAGRADGPWMLAPRKRAKTPTEHLREFASKVTVPSTSLLAIAHTPLKQKIHQKEERPSITTDPVKDCRAVRILLGVLVKECDRVILERPGDGSPPMIGISADAARAVAEYAQTLFHGFTEAKSPDEVWRWRTFATAGPIVGGDGTADACGSVIHPVHVSVLRQAAQEAQEHNLRRNKHAEIEKLITVMRRDCALEEPVCPKCKCYECADCDCALRHAERDRHRRAADQLEEAQRRIQQLEEQIVTTR